MHTLSLQKWLQLKYFTKSCSFSLSLLPKLIIPHQAIEKLLPSRQQGLGLSCPFHCPVVIWMKRLDVWTQCVPISITHGRLLKHSHLRQNSTTKVVIPFYFVYRTDYWSLSHSWGDCIFGWQFVASGTFVTHIFFFVYFAVFPFFLFDRHFTASDFCEVMDSREF